MISDKSNKLIPLNKIEKKEVIQARGISKSGEDYSLIQFFHKEKGEIVFDQLSEEIQSFSSFLDRIKEVWKEQK